MYNTYSTWVSPSFLVEHWIGAGKCWVILVKSVGGGGEGSFDKCSEELEAGKFCWAWDPSISPCPSGGDGPLMHESLKK